MPETLVRAALTDGVFAAGALALAVLGALLESPIPDPAAGVGALAVAVALAAAVAIHTNRRLPTAVEDLGRPVSVQRSVVNGIVLLVLVGATSAALYAVAAAALGVGMLALTGLMALTRSLVVGSWERRQGMVVVDDPADARRYAAVRA